MKKGIDSIRSKGFTLIEVLVTVVVIGVLAAVVIPAVTAQVGAGDKSRVTADLNNVRTGIENFGIAVRQFPGDVDDLVNAPGGVTTGSGSTVDADITGAAYVGTASWAGPYIEATVPLSVSSSTASASGQAFRTGYSAYIDNKFVGCAISAVSVCDSATSPNYVTIHVHNLTGAQASELNDLIDGTETASTTSGKFRAVLSGTAYNGYYFAAPFK